MDLDLSYTVSPEDYIDAQLTYNRDSDEVRKNLRKTRINVSGLYAFLALILYPALEGTIRFVVTGGILALAGAHLLLVGKLYEARVKRLSRKLIRDAKAADEEDRKKLRIDKDEINYIEKKRNTKVKIKDIARILESDRNYFLFWDESDAIILPKAIDGDTVTTREIVTYLRGASRS